VEKDLIVPQDISGEAFVMASNKASVLHDVVVSYLREHQIEVSPEHAVDNLAMAMSLVASTRGLSLMPDYANNLLPWSVVSRPLVGAPSIDLAIGYSTSNTSPLLASFLEKSNLVMPTVTA
jgi:LysR family hca operon transcriptional activator